MKRADVVHFDETPTRVGKAKAYFHVACTELLTFLHADITRGLDAVERVGVLPGYRGTAIHDRLAMYFNYTRISAESCSPVQLSTIGWRCTSTTRMPSMGYAPLI